MAETTVTIRAVESSDSASISVIYNHYVTSTTVSFEEKPVGTDEMTGRINNLRSSSLPWLVAEQQDEVIGYAYASPWKTRSAYRFAVEVTVYISSVSIGRGTGSELYARLIPMLQAQGVHTVIGGIALPNDSSIALHEKFGFKKVAHFQQVGFKFDRWIDVGYWQRVF
jgi:phosphinothricin acetyltransferase